MLKWLVYLTVGLVLEVPLGDNVVVLDSRGGLDGTYEDHYIDVTHFNQRGRDRLAANLFEGIAPLLRASPQLHCRARKLETLTGSD